MNGNDQTQKLHDDAARIGYAVESGKPAAEIERLREVARSSLSCVVSAKEGREIFQAAYDAGMRAAANDRGNPKKVAQ